MVETLTKLVGLTTPAPGGTGNFSAFHGGAQLSLTIGGGYVAFFAEDSAAVRGIYTVPVTGGPVKKVVTFNTIAPTGRTSTASSTRR